MFLIEATQDEILTAANGANLGLAVGPTDQRGWTSAQNYGSVPTAQIRAALPWRMVVFGIGDEPMLQVWHADGRSGATVDWVGPHGTDGGAPAAREVAALFGQPERSQEVLAWRDAGLSDEVDAAEALALVLSLPKITEPPAENCALAIRAPYAAARALAHDAAPCWLTATTAGWWLLQRPPGMVEEGGVFEREVNRGVAPGEVSLSFSWTGPAVELWICDDAEVASAKWNSPWAISATDPSPHALLTSLLGAPGDPLRAARLVDARSTANEPIQEVFEAFGLPQPMLAALRATPGSLSSSEYVLPLEPEPPRVHVHVPVERSALRFSAVGLFVSAALAVALVVRVHRDHAGLADSLWTLSLLVPVVGLGLAATVRGVQAVQLLATERRRTPKD